MSVVKRHKERLTAFASLIRQLTRRSCRLFRWISIGLFVALMLTIVGFVGYGKFIISCEDGFFGLCAHDGSLEQFPVSVNPDSKTIKQDGETEDFLYELAQRNDVHKVSDSFVDKVMHRLALFDWYQNLASSNGRILVIYPGERKEQIAHNFQKILKWSDPEHDLFLEHVTKETPDIAEGTFYPGKYVVTKRATPEHVARLITDRFDENILGRYGREVQAQVPLEDALIIASILEREAYDFTDMREISGVIWNRLFEDMKLQIDATLQYVRGSEPYEEWWPSPLPADKFIDSPYNTYKYAGLTPTAISNPSAEAVLAALNPNATDCLFYFHDQKASFYCSNTYEEHVEKLRAIYGRGK